MADEETGAELIETKGTEVEGEEQDEDEGSASIEDEFRSLFGEAKEEAKRLKMIAMKAEQAGDTSAATVLREVSGGVVQLMQELIATCGGAFADMEASVAEEGGSQLEADDAEKLHGLLTACRKLASEMLAASPIGEGRQGLETLIKLIDDQMEFVLEISEFEPPGTVAS